jgi:hypothetical protein
VPSFGPPAHPAFPSGHSFLGHFIALLLLEIPAIQYRYGHPNAVEGMKGDRVTINPPPRVVTISLANPAVVSLSSHDLKDDEPVCFHTTGELPEPIEPGQVYYVQKSGSSNARFAITPTPPTSGAPRTTVDTRRGRQSGVHTIPKNPLFGNTGFESPLLWLGQRQAKNRERLGVHYPSDSSFSRHLAAATWRALFDNSSARIVCPTLDATLRKAIAEWPTAW